ncbi:MAG: putative bifunctional diguanylate cyclase/phosphodiesterase [Sandaracinaceae bacterium]
MGSERRRLSSRAESAPAGARILVVEPDPDFRALLTRALTSAGHAVNAFEDEHAALAWAAVEGSDLVVCRVEASGRQGDLLGEVHALDPFAVFLGTTADPVLGDRLSGRAKGAVVGTVLRPCSSHELTQAVERALEVQSRQWCGRPSAAPPVHRVLLVEDDPDDALLTRRELKRAGYVVEVATRVSGAEAQLHDGGFHALVVDLSLPDAHGFDAVRRLRRAAPEAALVVLTGRGDPALHRQLVRMGAQDVLKKGGSSVEMLRAMELSLERSVYLSELFDMARHDQLTGLANRRTFIDRLQMASARCATSELEMGLLCIDLDHFKEVNDTLGHEAGDEVLVEVANRLQRAVRDEDTVARLGGDEFAIVLSCLSSARDAESIAARVVRSLARPVELSAGPVTVTASVGVIVLDEAGGDLDVLMRSADAAMYEAKRGGRNRAVGSGGKRGPARRSSPDAMATADSDVPLIGYRPRVRLGTGEVAGFEARAHRPKCSCSDIDGNTGCSDCDACSVSPGRVLDQVCLALAQLEDIGRGDLSVSLRATRGWISSARLVQDLASALAAHPIEPSSLELCFDEHDAMLKPVRFAAVAESLQALGVGIGMRGFGSGPSSLLRLREFRVKSVQLDPRLLEELPRAEEPSVTRGLVTLLEGLRLDVVATGIDSPARLDLAREQCCQLGQGPLLGAFAANPLEHVENLAVA